MAINSLPAASQGATGDPVGSVLFLQSLSTKHNENLSLLLYLHGRKVSVHLHLETKPLQIPQHGSSWAFWNCQASKTKLTPVIIKQGLARPSYTDFVKVKHV